MILSLAWKELREHRAIWFTMVVMTGLLGPALGEVVSAGDPRSSQAIAHLSILGLAATYGVVCGAMMLAGEHEGGTLTFLDIFLGRRWLLWLGKFGIGILLALMQAAVVAAVLVMVNQNAPEWGWGIVGAPRRAAGPAASAGPTLWFLVLPVVTLEAFAGGLFGSALARRVLSGAAIAVAVAAPVWLIGVLVPVQAFLGVRLAAALVLLIVSLTCFQQSLGDTTLGAPPALAPRPLGRQDRRRRALDRYADLDARERDFDWDRAADLPVAMPVAEDELVAQEDRPRPPPLPRIRRRPDYEQAGSPVVALWWLTFQQAWALFLTLAVACLLLGLFIPAQGAVLWPLGTLLIGVACGAAAFGAEQRDLSYQFLAALHMPLARIWRFKIGFWFCAALALLLFVILGGLLYLLGRNMDRPPVARVGFQFGNLRDLMGPLLFFGIWLVHGFAAGQVFVWLCRKTLLALALSTLVATAAIGMWLPSLLCGGLGGWQLWLAPLATLVVTHFLVRAWAGGRIKDRRPMLVLCSVAAASLAWLGLNVAYRMWQIPDVGEPLDREAFRAAIPHGDANAGGDKLREALLEMQRARDGVGFMHVCLARIDEAGRLPLGIVDSPPAFGQDPLLPHLADYLELAASLRLFAQQKMEAGRFDEARRHVAQLLLVSRALRNKAPLKAYQTGVAVEDMACEAIELWLARVKPDAKECRALLADLRRHVAETPPAVDCLRAECFRAGGNLPNPTAWAFCSGPGGPGRIAEGWLARGIAFSLGTPWESERKTRLWQLVWAGLFPGVEKAHWEEATLVEGRKDTTRRILRHWHAPAQGPAAFYTRGNVAALLDASWLDDDQLFADVGQLRTAAAHSRCQVDLARLSVALAIYQAEEGKTAAKLDDLVPKMLPELPIDPYCGKAFNYRISRGEAVDGRPAARPGQAILWSTGPDRIDHGGRKHGGRLADDNPDWVRDGLDIVTLAPAWR